MLSSDQSAVYVLDGAPTVFPSFQIGNCEIPLAVLEPLARHEMSIEAVARLDLATDDIILLHFVGGGHGCVGALVVGPDPRIQRPTRFLGCLSQMLLKQPHWPHIARSFRATMKEFKNKSCTNATS